MKLTSSHAISIFLNVCESRILTAELEKRNRAFEMKCHGRYFNISYLNHITNEAVRRKIHVATGKNNELLTLVKERILRELVLSQGLLV